MKRPIGVWKEGGRWHWYCSGCRGGELYLLSLSEAFNSAMQHCKAVGRSV